LNPINGIVGPGSCDAFLKLTSGESNTITARQNAFPSVISGPTNITCLLLVSPFESYFGAKALINSKFPSRGIV
jgi:hypothetical protein